MPISRDRLGQRFGRVTVRIDLLPRLLIVTQFHHIIETLLRFVLADVQDIDKTLVQSRNRLEFPDTGQLTLERALIRKPIAVDYLDRPKNTHEISGQPDLSIASVTDAAD
jgi:hypothetical protein